MAIYRKGPVVVTNHDGGPRERGERGVDIIDDDGGLIYLRDADLPRIIALLAQHLAGENVGLFAQLEPDHIDPGEDTSDALEEVEQQLSKLGRRREQLLMRQQCSGQLSEAHQFVPDQMSVVSLKQALFTVLPASLPHSKPEQGHKRAQIRDVCDE